MSPKQDKAKDVPAQAHLTELPKTEHRLTLTGGEGLCLPCGPPTGSPGGLEGQRHSQDGKAGSPECRVQETPFTNTGEVSSQMREDGETPQPATEAFPTRGQCHQNEAGPPAMRAQTQTDPCPPGFFKTRLTAERKAVALPGGGFRSRQVPRGGRYRTSGGKVPTPQSQCKLSSP